MGRTDRGLDWLTFLQTDINTEPSATLALRFEKQIKMKSSTGFGASWGPVVKNPNLATQEPWVNPWSRKIPQAMEQLSLCDTTSEPRSPNY